MFTSWVDDKTMRNAILRSLYERKLQIQKIFLRELSNLILMDGIYNLHPRLMVFLTVLSSTQDEKIGLFTNIQIMNSSNPASYQIHVRRAVDGEIGDRIFV